MLYLAEKSKAIISVHFDAVLIMDSTSPQCKFLYKVIRGPMTRIIKKSSKTRLTFDTLSIDLSI